MRVCVCVYEFASAALLQTGTSTATVTEAEASNQVPKTNDNSESNKAIGDISSRRRRRRQWKYRMRNVTKLFKVISSMNYKAQPNNNSSRQRQQQRHCRQRRSSAVSIKGELCLCRSTSELQIRCLLSLFCFLAKLMHKIIDGHLFEFSTLITWFNCLFRFAIIFALRCFFFFLFLFLHAIINWVWTGFIELSRGFYNCITKCCIMWGINCVWQHANTGCSRPPVIIFIYSTSICSD